MAPHLLDLNQPQLQAVTHGPSPLLILAGAGSGKTRVITRRIVHLIRELQVPPESILAVTFTNKAANEMKERARRLDEAAERCSIRTFHSFCAWFLRRNALAADLPEGFTIYDEDDSLKVVKAAAPGYGQPQQKDLVRILSRLKDRGIGPHDPEAEEVQPGIAEIYRTYERLLSHSGAVDFGGLILKTWQLLSDNHKVNQRTRQRWTHLLVDEFQDTNVAQFKLLRELSPQGQWLTVVGDDDQSIYRFRGAEVGNILGFSEVYPDTRLVRLEENYRSTGHILAAASGMIAHNSGRLGKTLWTKSGDGELVQALSFEDQDEEADFAARWVQGSPGVETAILYRTNAQSRAFETSLNRYNIPYRLLGGTAFYQREEVKDAVAYMAVLVNPRDRANLERILNKPSRGLGTLGLKRALELLDSGVPVGKMSGEGVWKGAAKRGIVAFDLLLEALRRESEMLPLSDWVNFLLKETGLAQHYLNRDQVEGTDRLENLGELVTAAKSYPSGREGMIQFLEQAALQASADRDISGALTLLITLHNAKGLEFERVMVAGLEEGIFPRGEVCEEIEEERRLFYVGMTRAKRHLLLTSARYRSLWGRSEFRQPSRFLDEIPKQHVAFHGLHGSGPGTAWKQGQRVLHEDYGEGYVVRTWMAGDDPVVQIRFDTGFMGKFLPAYTPLVKIE